MSTSGTKRRGMVMARTGRLAHDVWHSLHSSRFTGNFTGCGIPKEASVADVPGKLEGLVEIRIPRVRFLTISALWLMLVCML